MSGFGHYPAAGFMYLVNDRVSTHMINERHIVVAIVIFIFFALLPLGMSHATSGACSHHGGVNCAAGASFDGKVQCNDGWTNSSVYFSDADECKATCQYPSSSGCKTESDYGALQVKLNAMGGYLGGSASQQGALNQCRAEITSYQASIQAHSDCVATHGNSRNYTMGSGVNSSSIQGDMNRYCAAKYGGESYFDSAAVACRCSSGYALSATGQCVTFDQFCANRIGAHGYYDQSTDRCVCTSGYVLPNGTGQCISGDQYCSEKDGAHAWFNPDTMKCEWCEKNGIRGIKGENGECIYSSDASSLSLTSLIQSLSSTSLDEMKPGDTITITLPTTTTQAPEPVAKKSVPEKADTSTRQDNTDDEIEIAPVATSSTTALLNYNTYATTTAPHVHQKPSWFEVLLNGFLRLFGIGA